MTVEIEHRELTLTAGPEMMFRPQFAAWPRACPTCGSTRILSLAEALAVPGFTQNLLDVVGTASHVHLGRSRDGKWWICRDSLRSQ